MELVYQIIVFTKLSGSISSTLSIPHFCCRVLVHICLETLTEDFLNFLSSTSSVCPSSSCAILCLRFCTLCLSSFHHDDHACVLLCILLSTYSAASSSSLRNFLTGKFLSEEFIKIAYSPPSSRYNALSLASHRQHTKSAQNQEHGVNDPPLT